jgi:hypothetical protein
MMMFLVVEAKSKYTILLVLSGFGVGRVSVSVPVFYVHNY